MPDKVSKQTLVWVVMRRAGHNQYHIQGIASDIGDVSAEDVAIKMCRDETYFIFPVMLNTALPEKTIEAVGLYFPLKTNELSCTDINTSH